MGGLLESLERLQVKQFAKDGTAVSVVFILYTNENSHLFGWLFS